MANIAELQYGSLRPLLWVHVSTDNDGHPDISYSYQSTTLSSEFQSDFQAEDLDAHSIPSLDHELRHSSTSSGSSTPLSETATSSRASDDTSPIRVRIRSMPRKRKPTLRRSSLPARESLRDIRKKQSEEDLRTIYEAHTLAYLNDAIAF